MEKGNLREKLQVDNHQQQAVAPRRAEFGMYFTYNYDVIRSERHVPYRLKAPNAQSHATGLSPFT
jgi:hypothetical protein